jgi:hypothetical protein
VSESPQDGCSEDLANVAGHFADGRSRGPHRGPVVPPSYRAFARPPLDADVNRSEASETLAVFSFRYLLEGGSP